MSTWRLNVGRIDGRLAAIVSNPGDPQRRPTNVIVVDWASDAIVRLRDFYHAPYVLDGAAVELMV